MHLKPKNFFLLSSATIGNILGFSAGIAFSWTSPMLPKLNGSIDPELNPLQRPATLLEESWIAALLAVGSIFGPPLAGLAADKIGRKKTLLLLACPMLVSQVMMVFGKTVTIFMVARFLAGLGAGSVFPIVPLYLVEISEDHNRGSLCCLMSCFCTFGVLFSYAVGPFLTIQNFCLVGLAPLLIFIPACVFVNPESPYFLVATNDKPRLKKTLRKLRPNKNLEEIDNDVIEITKTVQEWNENKSGVRELYKIKEYRKGMIISLGLISIQQLAGIGAVMSYLQTIFDSANTGLSPEISVIIVGCVQMGVTVVTSSLVDVVGRKILLLVSSLGCCISLLSLGGYFFLKNQNFDVSSISFLPIASLISFTFFYNFGIGPLPWTVLAELFPSNVKATASSIMTILCFVENFTITLCFPNFAVILGMDYTFWLFATMCLLGTIFIAWFLPETKGKSVKEIQKLLVK